MNLPDQRVLSDKIASFPSSVYNVSFTVLKTLDEYSVGDFIQFTTRRGTVDTWDISALPTRALFASDSDKHCIGIAMTPLVMVSSHKQTWWAMIVLIVDQCVLLTIDTETRIRTFVGLSTL